MKDLQKETQKVLDIAKELKFDNPTHSYAEIIQAMEVAQLESVKGKLELVLMGQVASHVMPHILGRALKKSGESQEEHKEGFCLCGKCRQKEAKQEEE